MKFFCYIIIFFILFSCNKTEEIIDSVHDNGSVKTKLYYNNGLKTKEEEFNVDGIKIREEKFNNNKLYDTSFFWYDNGKISGIVVHDTINNSEFHKMYNHTPDQYLAREILKRNNKTMYLLDYYPNGNKQMKIDEENGTWSFWFENGQLSVESANINGKYKAFYPDGSKNKIGCVNDGLNDSTWSYYSPTGEIIQEIIYDEGKVIEKKIYNQKLVDSLFKDEKY